MFGHDSGKKAPYLAVFDIGATSVGVGIAWHDAGVTTVLWNTRVEYSYQAYDEYVRYERAMYSTLLDVGMKLLGDGIRAVRTVHPEFTIEHVRVVCVLESPWFFSAIGVAESSKEKPFSFSEDQLEVLEHEARTMADQKNKEHSWHEVVGESEIFEAERQQLELNGYLVDVPIRSDVNTARVCMYYAFVGTAIRGQVLQILERIIPHHTVILVSSTHLLARHYRATVGSGTGHRALLVEVEGRITSVATISRGAIVAIGTIPLGTNHILQAAAPDAVSTEEARGRLVVAVKVHESDSTTPLPEAITDASNEWCNAVLDECGRQSDGVVPPEKILLLASRRWNPILIPFLTKPRVLPGLRQERVYAITQCVELIAQPNPTVPVEKTTQQVSDSKLQLFAHATFYTQNQ